MVGLAVLGRECDGVDGLVFEGHGVIFFGLVEGWGELPVDDGSRGVGEVGEREAVVGERGEEDGDEEDRADPDWG